MKYTKNVKKVSLPLILLCIMFFTQIAYADVKVNVSEDKTEAYSYNAKETVNVNIEEEESAPLIQNIDDEYDDETVVNIEEDNDLQSYNSIVDVDEDGVPGTNSYYEDTFDNEDKEDSKEDDINYADEYYASKLTKGTIYEILNKDMVVQKNISYDKKSSVGYANLSKGSEVELIGFVTQSNKKMVEILTENNKVYYEDVDNFYNNAISVNATEFSRFAKGIYNDANKQGTEKGYTTCVIIAICFMLGTIFFVKFLDTSVFRLKNPDSPTHPYMNSIARVMPGAMIGSFIIIANMFDKNAVNYYFFRGFSFVGKNYELIHWVLQIMLVLTIYMVWRIILEGLRCFTFPCMIIRTIVLLAANLASFYLCYGLSYVGVAIYILLVLYQCICVDSYECADIMDEDGASEEDSEEAAEEDTEDNEEEESTDTEPEPEAL